jgi:thioester reductase-like protein
MTTLVTGASGVLGQALLSVLPPERVVAMGHSRPIKIDGCRALTGDITQPFLGLGRDQYDRLADELTAIVHCAAETRFDRPVETFESCNVEGTKRILALGEQAGVRVVYVSTAFIASRPYLAADGTDIRTGLLAYLDSKRAAESTVASSGLDTVIVRPSVIVGESTTGRIARMSGIHYMAGLVLQGRLPMIPADPGRRVDFLPQDVVARAIVTLLGAAPPRSSYWLTAGLQAPTVARVVETILSAGRQLGLPAAAPRYVAPDVVDRLVRPVFLPLIPDDARRSFEQALALLGLLAGASAFRSSLGGAELSELSVEREMLEGAWRRQIEWMIARFTKRAVA